MNIVLTGSVAYDYLMTFPGNFRDHFLIDRLDSISLSFLVESMTRLRGGIAPNIAYTLALLGERPNLWAAVGEDFEEYRHWLEYHGVETSGARVIPGVFTASFFVTTDQGNSQIASFYPGAMAYASQLSLREFQDNPPDLVMISPNDPEAMKQYIAECQELGFPYIYDPSQQIVRLTGEDLQCGIRGALALFVNDYEFALVQKMTGWKVEDVLATNDHMFVAVTCGDRGATIYTQTETHHIPVVVPERIIDPTGVGDAFRGGFLKGYCHGFDLLTCGRMGVLAATYCLEQRGPQGHCYTPEEFVTRYRAIFGDQNKLDQLIPANPGQSVNS
jgi:adenosine kinase